MLLKNSLLLFFLFVFYQLNQNARAYSMPFNIVPQMANFEPVYSATKEWEGGYQNNPVDKANKNSLGQYVGTKYGVSAVAYESYIGHPPTVDEMKSISRDVSKTILKNKYWDIIGGDSINNQDIAAMIFGTYVGNPSNTNKAVKAALNEMGHNVKVTSPYSNEVIKSINQSNSKKLFDAIKQAQIDYVLEPMRASGSIFYAGWNRKVSSFEFGGSKKKWIIFSLVLLAMAVGGYYAYRKGYTKKMIKWINDRMTE